MVASQRHPNEPGADVDDAPEPSVTNERAAIHRALYGHDRREILLALEPELFALHSHAEAWRALRDEGMNGQEPSLASIHARVSAASGWEAANRALLNDDDMVVITGNGFSVAALVQRVRTAAASRLRKSAAAELTCDAPDPAEAAELLRQAEALDQPGLAVAGRLELATVDGCSMMDLEIPRPANLLGDGVLTAGGFGILYGQPGTAKSWLGLMLERALARGEAWLGIHTRKGGSRVALIQLELPSYVLQDRMQSLGIGSHPGDINALFVSRPMLRGVFDLLAPGGFAELRAYIYRQKLDVLILDALSRTHSGDENDGREMGQLLTGIDAVRHDTGCAIVVIHHPRKSSAAGVGRKDGDDELDSLRGSSRFQSDPTLLMRATRAGSLFKLSFAKVSTGPAPAHVTYVLDARGVPTPIADPVEVSDSNRDRVVRFVRESDGPVSCEQVARGLGMSVATARRHLSALVDESEIGRFGGSRNTVYGDSAHSAQEGLSGIATDSHGNDL